MWCVGFLDAMIFCSNFARWLQKIMATCDVLVFCDAMLLSFVMCCFSAMRCYYLLWCVGFLGWSFVTTLRSPNEHFGSRSKRSVVSFRCNFQPFVAQIMYSHPFKVPRKCTTVLLFGLPKSSFGERKLCKMITKDSSIRGDVLVSGMLLSFVKIVAFEAMCWFLGCYYLL